MTLTWASLHAQLTSTGVAPFLPAIMSTYTGMQGTNTLLLMGRGWLDAPSRAHEDSLTRANAYVMTAAGMNCLHPITCKAAAASCSAGSPAPWHALPAFTIHARRCSSSLLSRGRICLAPASAKPQSADAAGAARRKPPEA